MAFVIDPFLLIGFGIIIAILTKWVAPRNPHVVYVLSAFTMLVTYFVAIGLFVNFDFFEPLWELLGAQTGTEFMINGIILPIAESGRTWQELTSLQLFIAILIFTIYPVFLGIGVAAGRILFGRNQMQEGLIGMFRP